MSDIPNEIIYFGYSDSEDGIVCTCNLDTCNADHNDTNSTEQNDDSNDEQLYMDVLMEIKSVLEDNSQVNCINALQLNQEMQKRLLELRRTLVAILDDITYRYHHNADLLLQNFKRGSGIGQSGAYLKGATFHFKGNMFFRDKNYRNAPNNPDYKYRSTIEKEMFPMDFDLRSRHIWSILDKVGVVQGVKNQVLEFLRIRENRHLNKKDKIEGVMMMNELHSEKLINLIEKVGDSFSIDWNEICAVNLRYRHSPLSCRAMWNIYLRPQLRRGKWTDEENEKLLEAVKEYKFQNWTAIADEVGKRSDYQCFVQFQTHVQYMMPERWSKWDKKDNQRLLDLVEKYTVNGVINWTSITTYFPNRPKTSLIAHYTYSLNPRISHKSFTPEEDLLLLAAVKQYGLRFSCFPRNLFPNRSVIQLRSRYVNTLQNRHNLTAWSLADDKKLMEFVTEHGTSSWLQCSQFMGNHLRTSCRTRFLTIKKFFEKNPDATLENLPRRNKLMVDSMITTKNWEEKVIELRKNPQAKLIEKKRNRQKKNADDPARKRKKVEDKANISNTNLEREGVNEIPDLQAESQCGTVKKAKDRIKQLNYFSIAHDAKLDQESEVLTNFKIAKCPNDQIYEAAVRLRTATPQNPESMPYADYLSVRGKNKISNSLKALGDDIEFQNVDLEPVVPSWSTLISLRAQQIQSACLKKDIPPEVADMIANSKEAQLFIERFRETFNSTADLITSKPSDKMLERICDQSPKSYKIDSNDIKKYFLDTYRLSSSQVDIHEISDNDAEDKNSEEVNKGIKSQHPLQDNKVDMDLHKIESLEKVRKSRISTKVTPKFETLIEPEHSSSSHREIKISSKNIKNEILDNMETAQLSTKTVKNLKADNEEKVRSVQSCKRTKSLRISGEEINDAVNRIIKSGTSINLRAKKENDKSNKNQETD